MRLESLADADAGLEDFSVGWSVIEDILAFSAVIRDYISSGHNSNRVDVLFALEQFLDSVLHCDTSPLVCVTILFDLGLDHLPDRLVGGGGVADEAGVVRDKGVISDLVFWGLQFHFQIESLVV